MQNIIIIGNGAAANSAAETFYKIGSKDKVVMLSREREPFYSPCALPDYLSGYIKREKLYIKKHTVYPEQQVRLLQGVEVHEVDYPGGRVRTSQGDMSFDRLILATGSRPVMPEIPGSRLTGNFVLKTIGDVEYIMRHNPKHAVIVGSGNIGLETAVALAARKCRVCLVEKEQHIMPRVFGPAVSAHIQRIAEENGIQVMTGEEVVGVQGGERVQGVETGTGVLPAVDTVIWAVGMKPDTRLAREAGAALGDLGGIAVNAYMQTALQAVYACGDCVQTFDLLCGEPILSLLWPSARQQGKIAALNNMGYDVPYEGALNYITGEIFGTSYISIGNNVPDTRPGSSIVQQGGPDWHWCYHIWEEKIVGFEAIGVQQGLSAMMNLIRKRMTIDRYQAILHDPCLRNQAIGLLPAQRYLDHYPGQVKG